MRLIHLLSSTFLVVAGCTYTIALPVTTRKLPAPYKVSSAHPFNDVCNVRLISISPTGDVVVKISGQLATARAGEPFLLVQSHDGTGLYLQSVNIQTGEVIYGLCGFSG